MDINSENILVSSNNIDNVPIKDGQLIALKDSDALLYDANGTRHLIGGFKELLESVNGILSKYGLPQVTDIYNMLSVLDNMCKFNELQINTIHNYCGIWSDLSVVDVYNDSTGSSSGSHYKTIDEIPDIMNDIKPLCANPEDESGDVTMILPINVLSSVLPIEDIQPYIDIYDWNKAKYFNYIFINQTSLTSVPNFKNLHPIMMISTFESCYNLVDISNVYKIVDKCRYFSSCFSYCSSLTDITLEAPQGVNFSYCFSSCSSLETINRELDFSRNERAYDVQGTFSYCTKLKNVRFKANSLKYSTDLKQSVDLTQDSVNSIIDGLATVSSTQYIGLPSNITTGLSEEQLTIIRDKNWRTR